MKIEQLEVGRSWEGNPTLTITLNKAENSVVEQLLNIDSTNIKEYELKIEKRRKKRSLDANAYCWVLCKKLADVLMSTDKEIYQNMIVEYGVSEIVPVRSDKVGSKIDFYERQGLGDTAEDMGECKALQGFNNVKRYYGSSNYNSKQMATLLDGLVYECKEQGIETLPPDEIKRLKEMWK